MLSMNAKLPYFYHQVNKLPTWNSQSAHPAIYDQLIGFLKSTASQGLLVYAVGQTILSGRLDVN